jgi:DNA-binding PadR family transcriptional regulator
MNKTNPRRVANPLGLAVLAFLVMGPMHPYELGRRLIESGKDRNIKFNRGSLYMVVEQLRKAAFIEAHEIVRDSQRPERTIYSLTPLGRSELHDWMRELLARPQSEFPQFGVALSLLAVLTPAESAALLTQRLAALDAEIGEIEDTMRGAEDRGVAWIFLIEEEYRKDLVRAERDFVERLIESLNRPDYVQAWQEMFEGNV